MNADASLTRWARTSTPIPESRKPTTIFTPSSYEWTHGEGSGIVPDVRIDWDAVTCCEAGGYLHVVWRGTVVRTAPP